MFFSKDTKAFKWYWLDKKMHTVTIEVDGELMDIEDLYKTATTLVKDKEDMCKTINYLGLGMTGSPEAAWGFLLGWLIRSIKKDKGWQIQHTDEEVPQDEVNNHVADALENYAKMVRSGELDKNTTSTPFVGGSDGTDLFKS